MLHTNTVAEATLERLTSIQAIEELQDFSLAGGTALALQIGHRISVDLDFFGKTNLSAQEIIDIVDEVGKIKILHQSKNILIIDIDGIKVDFVNYKYPLLSPIIITDSIRLYSKKDIAAMKLAAISGRGRKRDFTDLYFLLKEFSLSEMIRFYKDKFPDGSEFSVIRSLSYFEDAEEDPDLILLEKVSWDEIKTTIKKEVIKLL